MDTSPETNESLSGARHAGTRGYRDLDEVRGVLRGFFSLSTAEQFVVVLLADSYLAVCNTPDPLIRRERAALQRALASLQTAADRLGLQDLTQLTIRRYRPAHSETSVLDRRFRPKKGIAQTRSPPNRRPRTVMAAPFGALRQSKRQTLLGSWFPNHPWQCSTPHRQRSWKPTGSDRGEFGVNNPEQVPTPASPYTTTATRSSPAVRLRDTSTSQTSQTIPLGRRPPTQS